MSRGERGGTPTVANLSFLNRSRYFFFQVAPHLSLRGWMGPVPDPLLLRKSGSAGNRSQDLWVCSQKLWPQDHRGGRNIKMQTGHTQNRIVILSVNMLGLTECINFQVRVYNILSWRLSNIAHVKKSTNSRLKHSPFLATNRDTIIEWGGATWMKYDVQRCLATHFSWFRSFKKWHLIHSDDVSKNHYSKDFKKWK
jgi:hypothetical protein